MQTNAILLSPTGWASVEIEQKNTPMSTSANSSVETRRVISLDRDNGDDYDDDCVHNVDGDDDDGVCNVYDYDGYGDGVVRNIDYGNDDGFYERRYISYYDGKEIWEH